MKKLLASASLIALFMSISACSLFSVTSELKDESAFAQAQTYAWRSKAIPTSANKGSKPQSVDQKVRTAANEVMTAKGYQLVTDDADLYLDYKYKITPTVVAEQPESAEASISFSRDKGLTKQNANTGTSNITYSAEFMLEIFNQDKRSQVYKASFTSKDIEHDTSKDIDKHIKQLTRRMQLTIPQKTK
jgi:hypothetical protein